MINAISNQIAKNILPFVICGLVMTIASTTLAADTVKVSLKNGQTYAAQIDARTTSQTLWLTFENQRTKLLKPIAWNQVQDLQVVNATENSPLNEENSDRSMAEVVLELLHN